MTSPHSSLQNQVEQLLATLRSYGSCAVAFSGGVDSAVVAQAAYQALGDRAVAVLADSPSLASGEREAATAVARQIGIQLIIIQTQEVSDPAYRQNSLSRCYHCKDHLYQQLAKLQQQDNLQVIVNGTNADDLNDYRPGLAAASQWQVRSPLAECQLTKDAVRQIAFFWGLPVWDKPATPCLSSRIAYGQEVTSQRLAQIDAAEAFLKSLGLSEVRVRYHGDDLARVEVPTKEIAWLCSPPIREQLVRRLSELGFRHITVDLQGFRSGSLNPRNRQSTRRSTRRSSAGENPSRLQLPLMD